MICNSSIANKKVNDLLRGIAKEGDIPVQTESFIGRTGTDADKIHFAGAGVVTVEIKNGGISYIGITDNGCGFAREDVPVAFKRHATSKIRTEEDLNSIATLGFRGEALASGRPSRVWNSSRARKRNWQVRATSLKAATRSRWKTSVAREVPH